MNAAADAAAAGGEPPAGAWHPGIASQVPQDLLHLSTIFRPEHVFTSLASAMELRGLTGFALSELVAFRPERLALHELLIRVTADFAVPDGSRIGDLGINFREIARSLLSRVVQPHMDRLVGEYHRSRGEVRAAVEAALAAAVPALAAPARRAPPVAVPGLLRRLARGRARPGGTVERNWGPQEIAALERRAAVSADPLCAAVSRTLARILSALFTTQGHAWGTRELILSLATDMVANEHGSAAVGRTLEPLLLEAARRDGLRLLPRQDRPVVINTKGASASGKSTLRPLQKKLAGDIGVRWEDFALISPDIWRKQLLDYASLAAAYKYAGAFTGEELQIVDQKLDRHMADKNRRGEMSHLLIDRFRFDSFAPDSDEAGSNLLTRFGHTVFLFFVITPPELLVERAWKRGLEFGRYKAVDDTLAHAVQAYGGIPDLFFTWIRRSDKRIRFEFLDNTVPFGERPRTVAFGDNATCNVLDVGNLMNIDRFARIDVNAGSAAALYPDRELLAARHNTAFLRRCIGAFRDVNFVDPASGRVYLQIRSGSAGWRDDAALQAARADADTRAGIRAVAGDAQADDAVAGDAQTREAEAHGSAPGADSKQQPAPWSEAATADACTQVPTLGQWAGVQPP